MDNKELIERLRWDFPSEPEFWQPDPPTWAKDIFNGDEAGKCGDCGSWLDCVRPGKFQCPACGSDGDKAARWQSAAAIEAAESALTAAREENERLREGLRPFAEVAANLPDHISDAVPVVVTTDENDDPADFVHIADFRRARTLTKGHEQ